MREIPKHIKRVLREIEREGYEEEMRRALAPLADDFERWRRGELSSTELASIVQTFETGAARELDRAYGAGFPDVLAARLVHTGIIDRARVPAEVLEFLSPMLAFLDSR